MHPVAPSVPPVPDRLRAALGLMRQRALATCPQEAAYLHRGYALARLGGVHLVGDGLAVVQSDRQPTTWYPVAGRCGCPDSPWAPEGRCPHRWATLLLTRALTYLAQQSPEPFDTLPAPYACPPWRDDAAMYQGPASCGAPVQGVAEWIEPGHFFFRPVGQETGWHCDATEVAIGPAREDASSGAPWGPTAQQQSWAPETRVPEASCARERWCTCDEGTSAYEPALAPLASGVPPRLPGVRG